MCNEKTATYWTGGGSDSHNEDDAPPSLCLMGGQMDMACNLATDPRPLTNVRVYLPLQKTLRNLRLLDLRLKYNSQQVRLPAGQQESSSSSDESDPKAPEPREEEEEDEGQEKDRASLIQLLTLCHCQLQQYEELKRQSQRQSQMLWEAQETIGHLRDSVAALHCANAQKEEELFFLWEELIQCKRLLREKTERITDMREMFRNFGEHLGKRGSTPQSNEHLGAENPVTEDPNSKICVIL
ncbi:uncharacterized protein LOC116410287 [Xenopus tropicalis]|uniref:Uncharacterized protein LOC116410287 n=1 Tax=Xenopus tropicalis TaxID=8364 RepID=A0A8J1JEQ6_XENTR|nr:uncharacterized protein LOC116410287 [Xenopus tropicalis]